MRLSVGLFVKERGISSLRFYEIGYFQILYKFDVKLDTARSSKIEYILNINAIVLDYYCNKQVQNY